MTEDDASPQHRLLQSRSAFQEAVREALAQVAGQGCRELFISDMDFAEWPLGEPSVIESLSRWALPHRRLTVLAQSYDELLRKHPRWVNWRRQWDHVVSCRTVPQVEAGQVPCLLLAPGVVTVRLFDTLQPRGSVSTHADDAIRAREHLDALLQQSCETFSASVLGL